MLIVWIVAIFISCLYFVVIFLITIGWYKIPLFIPDDNPLTTGITVIVPVRNEQNSIISLLRDLSNQNISKNLYELIIVDDNSTDNTYNIVKEYVKDFPNFKIIYLKNKIGKKEAISTGISIAKYELIITTDADCRISSRWLFFAIKFYEKFKPKMIIGPVVMNSKNIFGHLQSLEFFSLVTAAAGAVGINKPIMCNGANLAFEKSIFLEIESEIDKAIVSGDDIFLLHSIKKRFKNKIMYLKSNDFKVNIFPATSIKNFLNQRLRWTSKSKSYKDFDTIFTSFVILLTNLSIFVFFIWTIVDLDMFYVLLYLFLCKTTIDLVLLISASKFFKNFKLLFFFIPLQVIYFVYISFIGVAGNFMSYGWKSRKLKTRYL